MRPRVAPLGRIPGTARYSDLERNPDNEPMPGVLILRVEASILYFNAEYVRDEIRRRLREAPASPRAVVLDLSSSPSVDVTGALMLSALQSEMTSAGVALRLVEARSGVRDLLRRSGLDARVGDVDRRTSLHDLVESFIHPPEKGESRL
jgi:MFS superfamily sulfate permease-like transporter